MVHWSEKGIPTEHLQSLPVKILSASTLSTRISKQVGTYFFERNCSIGEYPLQWGILQYVLQNISRTVTLWNMLI